MSGSAEPVSTLRELEQARDEGRALLAPLSPDEWRWKPSKDRWSVGECVVHVNQTNRVYLPAIEAAMRKGRDRGILSPGPYRHGFLGEFMIREIEPPPRRRFRVPRLFIPPSSEVGPAALAEYEALLLRTEDGVRRAEGLDFGKVAVTSPANRFLRLSLGQAFRLIAAHARRHLWQARRVAEESGFPRVPGRAAF